MISFKGKPSADHLVEHLESFIQDTLARCTQCGECFKACPMTEYGPGLKEARPQEAVAGILDWLKGVPNHATSLDWLKVCTQSSVCIKACPENINVMKMMRTAQVSALGSLGAQPALKSRDEKDFFRKINAFSATQLTTEEIEKWQR